MESAARRAWPLGPVAETVGLSASPGTPADPAAGYQELRISRQVDLARLVLAIAEFG